MPKTRILLVDDEKDSLVTISKILESQGYDVVTALSGKEAIGEVVKKSADLIVLDYKMPDMDGIETLREIRKHNTTIPVLMFTSFPNGDSIHDSEALGVSGYIPKNAVFSDAKSSLLTTIRMIEKRLGAKG